MPVAGPEDQKVEAAEKQIERAVQQHQVNIGKRIFPGIGLAGVMAMAIIAQQDFKSYDDKVYRSADEEQYLFSEVFQDFKIKANNATW
jgi:hypothetical protein